MSSLSAKKFSDEVDELGHWVARKYGSTRLPGCASLLALAFSAIDEESALSLATHCKLRDSATWRTLHATRLKAIPRFDLSLLWTVRLLILNVPVCMRD